MTRSGVTAGSFAIRRAGKAWWVVLKVLFGLPLDYYETRIFRAATGRTEPSLAGYKELWLICGRKAGKSRILALVAVFLAVYHDWSDFLSPGETGCIKIIATDRKQAGVIYKVCARTAGLLSRPGAPDYQGCR